MWWLSVSVALAGLGSQFSSPETVDDANQQLDELKKRASEMEDRGEDGTGWLQAKLTGAFDDLAIPVFADGLEVTRTRGCTASVRSGPRLEASDPAAVVVSVTCGVEMPADDANFALFAGARPNRSGRTLVRSAPGLLSGPTPVSRTLERKDGVTHLVVEDALQAVDGLDWASNHERVIREAEGVFERASENAAQEDFVPW